jgi:glycosyltransferase involved in cell wall biosynthesis
VRILYLMTEPFGVGGVQSDILTLSRELTARGHEVHVATTPGILLDELKSRGAIFHDADFHFREPRGLWRAVRTLKRLVRDTQVELLAPQSVRTTITCWSAMRLLRDGYRVPATGKRPAIVTTIHNIHNPMHFRYGGHILNRCSDYVIFESHYERDRLLKSGLRAARSEVVHSGIDTDRFKPVPLKPELGEKYGLRKGEHVIYGIVARLSEEKGHVYLVRAFQKVHAANPRARLVVVGDGPLLGDVQAQVKAAGLDGAVVFTGMQRNVPDYLALFDVFVLSSTRESFPLAAREAMAAGKAVIAPRIGGCPEVVDEGVTGLLFEAANVDELAACMTRITEGRAYEGWGENARARVERLFSQRQWVDGDERIYQQWLQ